MIFLKCPPYSPKKIKKNWDKSLGCMLYYTGFSTEPVKMKQLVLFMCLLVSTLAAPVSLILCIIKSAIWYHFKTQLSTSNCCLLTSISEIAVSSKRKQWGKMAFSTFLFWVLDPSAMTYNAMFLSCHQLGTMIVVWQTGYNWLNCTACLKMPGIYLQIAAHANEALRWMEMYRLYQQQVMGVHWCLK